jgi:hypothetical protein
VETRCAAAERAEEVRAASGRAAEVRARGRAAAPNGQPTEPSWLGRDAGAARGREPESNRFKNNKKMNKKKIQQSKINRNAHESRKFTKKFQ